MKTFKEFCEQAYNPFVNKPEHPVKRFARDVVSGVAGSIKRKLSAASRTAADVSTALGINKDPDGNYMSRDYDRRQAQMRLRGVNPNNPDNMNTKLQFKTHQKFPNPIDYSVRYSSGRSPKKGFGGKPTTEV